MSFVYAAVCHYRSQQEEVALLSDGWRRGRERETALSKISRLEQGGGKCALRRFGPGGKIDRKSALAGETGVDVAQGAERAKESSGDVGQVPDLERGKARFGRETCIDRSRKCVHQRTEETCEQLSALKLDGFKLNSVGPSISVCRLMIFQASARRFGTMRQRSMLRA